MIIDVCFPCSIERYQSPSVDCPAEDIFWNKIPFVPEQRLLMIVCVFSLANAHKPVMVSVVGVSSMFEPFVDEHVGFIVVERVFDEL